MIPLSLDRDFVGYGANPPASVTSRPKACSNTAAASGSGG